MSGLETICQISLHFFKANYRIPQYLTTTKPFLTVLSFFKGNLIALGLGCYGNISNGRDTTTLFIYISTSTFIFAIRQITRHWPIILTIPKLYISSVLMFALI